MLTPLIFATAKAACAAATAARAIHVERELKAKPRRMNPYPARSGGCIRPAVAFTVVPEYIDGSYIEDGQLLTVLHSYFPFYNHSRMHSSLNYVSPAAYESQLA